MPTLIELPDIAKTLRTGDINWPISTIGQNHPDRPEALSTGETPNRPAKLSRGRPKKAEELPGGSTPLAVSPADKQSARKLLAQIGEDFARNRRVSKSKAFETYQHDLANNADALIMGGAVTLKELTVLLMDLEAFMKSTVREGETAATRLQKFLSGDLANEDES